MISVRNRGIRGQLKGLLLTFLLIFSFLNLRGQAEKKPIILQAADSAIMIQEVTVSAYRVPGRLLTTPGSISVLTGEKLNISDGLSLASTLNTVPGVTMQSGTLATGRIVIRGMGSRTPYGTNRIRAYLNDIPLTTADGVSTPEEIDLSGIGRMEIIKGPSSSLYGSGLGGSINMYTPLSTENQGNIEAQYGSFNTGKVLAAGTLEKGKAIFWGSLGHVKSDGYRENNDYRRTTLLSTSRWEHKEWSLNTTLLLIDINAGIPSSVGKTQFLAHPEQAATNWKAIEGYKQYTKGIAAISLNNNFTSRLTSQLMLFGKLNDSYEKRPFNNLDDQSVSGGLRYKISYQGRKMEWLTGAEWIAEQYRWKLDKDGDLLNENEEIRKHLNFFSILNYKPVKAINISAAVAFNHIDYKLTDRYLNNGDQTGKRTFPMIFSPRLGINYSPSDKLALYASAGHGFSLPSPEETLLPAGDVNPDIKPEQGYQYETGIRLNLADNAFEIDASVYLIELSNLLVNKRITEDIFTGINAGRTRHKGFELLLQARLFNYSRFPGKFTSIVSYTRSVNRFIDFTDNNITYNGNSLPGIPGHALSLHLRWEIIRILEISSYLQYTGFQYLNDDNSLEYPEYFLADLKLSTLIKLKKENKIRFSAGINNFTDTRYASMLVVNALTLNNSEPRYYYPGLPRHFYAGMNFMF